MKNFKIIQYLPLVRPRAIKRLIPQFSNRKINLILDLEDSAQDIFDNAKTHFLKKKSREGLKYLSSELNNIKLDCEIFIRINGIKTEYFSEDLLLIKDIIKENFPLEGIFFPKIESYDQLVYLNKEINNFNNNINIVPMFETCKGILNLEKILEEDNNKIIRKFHYGHFDYCLDSNIWPFTYPNDLDYWEIVKKLVKISNQYKISYVHTPFPLINNVRLFWEMSNYLSTLIDDDQEYYLSTVNTEISFSTKKEEYRNLKIDSVLNTSQENKIIEAKKIISLFENKKINSRSFSKSNDLFIPPHQYILAKKILGDKRNYGK